MTTSPPLISYRDKFEELFPYYLSIGMTAEQYWECDSTLVIAFRKADRLLQERKNIEMWRQGAYFYYALLGVAPVLRAFAKNGTKPHPYLEQPFEIGQKTEGEKKATENKIVYDRNRKFMEMFMIGYNQRYERK